MDFLPFAIFLTLLINSLHAKKKTDKDEDKSDEVLTADSLLRRIVPNGHLPQLPDGFPSLTRLKTEHFDYSIDGAKVTVTSILKQPVPLFGGGFKLYDVKMTFTYDDKHEKDKWSFKARGIWKKKKMRAAVKIEDSKVGDHHTMIGITSAVNVFDIASTIASRERIETSGVDLDALRALKMTNVQLYSVFKNNKDFVFLINGKPKLQKTNVAAGKVFIRKSPDKDTVFSMLLEFEKDSPSRVLVNLISDKLFKLPFINHLIGKTQLLRGSKENFAFVASTGEVKRLPLKSFGKGFFESELGSHLSKGITLLLPIHLGGAISKRPINMAVVVSPPKVSFVTAKHEHLTVKQTLKALSPNGESVKVPKHFPQLDELNVRNFSYHMKQESFSVFATMKTEFNLVPGLLKSSNTVFEFRLPVRRENSFWTLEATGKTDVGGSIINFFMDSNEIGDTFLIQGSTDSISLQKITDYYKAAILPQGDEDGKFIIKKNKLDQFVFSQPQIRSSITKEGKNYIHIAGRGKLPHWTGSIDMETVITNKENGEKEIITSYMFYHVALDEVIEYLSGFDTHHIRLFDRSYNTSVIVSPTNTESMFLSPILSGLYIEKGVSLVGLLKAPGECHYDKTCEIAQHFMAGNQLYRIQGQVSKGGFILAGMIDNDLAIAPGIKLKNNMLEFVIEKQSWLTVTSTMDLPQYDVKFYGNVYFNENGAEMKMKSDDILDKNFRGKFFSFDKLHINIPIFGSNKLENIPIKGQFTLGERGSGTEVSGTGEISIHPTHEGQDSFRAQLQNLTLPGLVSALDQNAYLPEVLRSSVFPGSVDVYYPPSVETKTEVLDLNGQMKFLNKELAVHVKIDESKNLETRTSHAKSPLILEDGLIVIQGSNASSSSGPRILLNIKDRKTSVKVVGFARFLGMSSETDLEVDDKRSAFSMYGSLFQVGKTVITMEAATAYPEQAKFLASGCLPDIIPEVIKAVDNEVLTSAEEADSFVTHATNNLHTAQEFYKKATNRVQYYKQRFGKAQESLQEGNRELWQSQRRYNSSCDINTCSKECIGCPEWKKCCTHDVFGNCVPCPSWNRCCTKNIDPVCIARNHGCKTMSDLTYADYKIVKDKVSQNTKEFQQAEDDLLHAEFSEGKTKAVVDAAQKALSLINRDSTVGQGASQTIKRMGLNNVIAIQSICFKTSLEKLASSCIDMEINATLADAGQKTMAYYGCLTKDLIPKMSKFMANKLFPEITASKKEKVEKQTERDEEETVDNSLEEDDVSSPERTRRDENTEADQGESDDEIEPFWELKHGFDPLKDKETTAASAGAVKGHGDGLKRKWKIPATKSGRCRIYHQLLDICRDMMKTVKKIYGSLHTSQWQFKHNKNKLSQNLKEITAFLEQRAAASKTEDHIKDIEEKLTKVNKGFNTWDSKCSKELKHQNEVGMKAWVNGMDSKIKKLGGDGVSRFLSNLFGAFEGLFESPDVPQNHAAKALTTLKTVRQISMLFDSIFSNDVTVEDARAYANRVFHKLSSIKDIGIFCTGN